MGGTLETPRLPRPLDDPKVTVRVVQPLDLEHGPSQDPKSGPQKDPFWTHFRPFELEINKDTTSGAPPSILSSPRGAQKGYLTTPNRVLGILGPSVVPATGAEYLTSDMDPRGLDPWGYLGHYSSPYARGGRDLIIPPSEPPLKSSVY